MRKKHNKKRKLGSKEQKLNWHEQRIRDQFTDIALAVKQAAATQNIRDPLVHLADAINNAATEMRNLREKSHTLEKLAELLHIAKIGVK